MIGTFIITSGVISGISFLDTYVRNKSSIKYFSKKGYKVKKNSELYSVEKTNNFIHDYLVCFIPLLNVCKLISNVFKNNTDYRNDRLEYLKSRNMIKFGRYDKIIEKEEKKQLEVSKKSNEMTLDDERGYYKNMSDQLHDDYDKLIKLKKFDEAKKVKEVLEITDECYYQIIEEMDLEHLKYSDNKSVQRMLKRK